ncbi:hypothetical protein FA95DRAFT_1554880 [Auriscalpium vulgare]|uniref:Uncharacterized protein n=1 Tax=Auriscalpium vulgare TaxID=40419 RepID=A0ACB8S5I2_9AGAM|nr:hypothetical protein FA95DRAFT_1554880 [Auriscalpium vulgare]
MGFQLPIELIEMFLEAAYYLPAGQPDYKSLAACSQVCRQWELPARRLLYADLSLGRDMDMGSIVTSPATGALVCSVELTIGAGWDTAIAVLLRCRQLYQLTLHVASSVMHIQPAIIDSLCALSLNIRALDLEAGSSSTVVYELLEVWPSIRHLNLRESLYTLPPAIRPAFSLYELSVRGVNVTPHAMEWLISPRDPSSGVSTRILGLHKDRYTACPAVSTQAPFIQSLTLQRWLKWVDLGLFTDLKELIMFFIPGHPIPPLQGIEHLAIQPNYSGVSTPDQLEHVLDAVRTLPNLKHVSISEAMSRRPDFPTLRAACEERTVDVVVLPLETEPRSPPGYLVWTDHYPRRRTLSCLRRLMSFPSS